MATKLDMAEQQLYGWHAAIVGERLLGLVGGMGLTRKEWEKLCGEGLVSYLSDDEINEIDNYFAEM